MRKTIGRIATVAKAAKIGGFTTEELIEKIEGEIDRKIMDEIHKAPAEATAPSTDMDDESRKEGLRSIILDLHAGEDIESAKARFDELIKDISPKEIAMIEQKLIAEGMEIGMLKKLSEVHIQMFKDSLDEQEMPEVSPGHPVHTYMKENRYLENILEELDSILKKVGDPPGEDAFKNSLDDIRAAIEKLQRIDVHYARKENQLFPILETKDITGPSSVMWEVHDDIRAQLKNTRENAEKSQITETIEGLKKSSEMLKDMIYKEESILFPLSLDNLTEEEWGKLRSGDEEIGYAWITPDEGWVPEAKDEIPTEEIVVAKDDKISLDTGKLTAKQLNLILKLLPVDISFVDENDQVAYYSDVEDRIFPRSPSIIGREVQKCHPPKSLHKVERIVQEFKDGTKDVAEFYITMDGRFLHIRYFPVRDEDGKYIGTLEVSQDLTRLRSLEGEKRLLDWE
jgi:DUF438 domain-containing protein